jgi:hypothetical protein
MVPCLVGSNRGSGDGHVDLGLGSCPDLMQDLLFGLVPPFLFPSHVLTSSQQLRLEANHDFFF